MDGKVCPDCGEHKDSDAFYKSRTKSGGLQTYCKVCANKRTKQFFKTEKGRAAQQRANTSDKARKTKRLWSKTEKGRRKAIRDRATEGYKISHRRTNRKYQQNNRQQINAQSAVRYAVRMGKLAAVSSLLCAVCEQPAHHYHHYNGYDRENYLTVTPVCK